MSIKTVVNSQNSVDIDDDNDWDDWGDAEDNFTDESPKLDYNRQPSEEKITKCGYSNIKSKSHEKIEKSESICVTNEEPQMQHQGTQNRQPSGWGSLFGDVVSSVLSTATGLTTTVSHGLDKVIGVPDPAEMARINALQEAKSQSQEKQQESYQTVKKEETSITPTNVTPAFGLGLVNNVTSLGSKVLNTGLDTLEGIGKKTMNILQENDPLLKNKIKKLGLEQDKPNLSEILKEAKQENEQLEKSLKELNLEKSKAQLRFEILFENNCGLMHLEALEILSKESQLKIEAVKESLHDKALEDLIENLNDLKALVEIEDLECEPENEDYDKEELNSMLQEAIEDMQIKIQFEDITELWSSCKIWLTNAEGNDFDAQAIFSKGITSLADTCAYEMLKLHKIAELLLVKECNSIVNEIDSIVELCKQFNIHLQVVANRFAAHLCDHFETNEAKIHINTLFAEMLQARQKIEKAFHLFVPILQKAEVKSYFIS